MASFQRLNNLTAWLVFFISLTTYTLTVEPTASFWDCGEFIACAFKLEVPHPPGAPLFLLLGRLFSLFALGDTSMVAFWVNMLSVVASAFTILFMHWTIVMIGRKIYGKPFAELSASEAYTLLFSGAVGSLLYAFSDTFWFSAVEAEVYALSSFFTAIVVWAAFKWELVEDKAQANRWVLFIAYLVGLSIGIHLLNLVTLPALALLMYFKNNEKPSYKGGFIAIFLGLVVLGIINSAIIPGLPSIALQFELFFVNTMGLGFGSGALFFLILLLAAIVFGIRYSYQKGNEVLNVSLFALVFVLIGYSTYTAALIRSSYNPPINENDPSNILNFLKYLKREQYGERSLLYGPVFTAQIENFEQGDPVYKTKDGKYEVYTHKAKYEYEKDQQMLLPRVWSNDGSHIALYQEMLDLAPGQKPSFGDNLRFMFNHQMGHMYMRYLLWNFVGRESDIQDAWAINPLEDTSKMPDFLAKNKARNNYYFLPLILVLIGFYLMYAKNEKDFIVTILLFVLTGIALVVYLNSPPVEPRERDYIYVGSFYFLAIWAGLAMIQLRMWLDKILGSAALKWAMILLFGLSAPLVLAKENWDDHDRSQRYHQVDFAKNLLNSCAPNAILFTGGDNDTFPLWYVQEVEGFRTDVRVCNLSLLGTDWYIDQMKRQTYESQPLPIKLKKDLFLEGVNDQIMYNENKDIQAMSLPDYLELLRNDDARIKAQTQSGEFINTFPCDSLVIPVNAPAVLQASWFPKELAPFLSNQLSWRLPNKNIFKGGLIMLEIIANNAQDGWKRPIYFSSTLPNDQYLGLKESMQLEGYAYRLMPIRIPGAKDGYANTQVMHENFTKKMFWRELDNEKVYYHGDFYLGIPSVTARLNSLKLADQLVREGQLAKAKSFMDYINKVMPNKVIPYDQFSASMVGLYLASKDEKSALAMAKEMILRNDKALDYYATTNGKRYEREIQIALYEMNIILNACKEYGVKPSKYSDWEARFTRQLNKFQ